MEGNDQLLVASILKKHEGGFEKSEMLCVSQLALAEKKVENIFFSEASFTGKYLPNISWWLVASTQCF